MSFKVDFIEELKLGLKGIFGSDLVVKEGLDHFKIHVEEIAGTQLHELSTLVKKADLGSHLRRSGTGITILLFKL